MDWRLFWTISLLVAILTYFVVTSLATNSNEVVKKLERKAAFPMEVRI